MGVALCALAFALAGCGSGDGDDDSGSTPAGSATAGRTASAAVTLADPEATGTPATTAEAAGTAAPGIASGEATAGPSGGNPAPPPRPVPTGRTYTMAEAQAILQSVLTPADIGSGWGVMSDVTSDNATAAAADPRGAASFERCGRLIGRLSTLQAAQDQLVSRYLAGQSVSFFTNLTVYATVEGATVCSIEAAQRFSEPGELARVFSSIFVDVNAVVVTPVDFPQVADGSIAFTLKGQINAAGTIVDLTILLVAFRQGNTSAVVGSAAAAAPSAAELGPLVDRVIGRIAAAQ
jgi:hypothetical protein